MSALSIPAISDFQILVGRLDGFRVRQVSRSTTLQFVSNQMPYGDKVTRHFAETGLSSLFPGFIEADPIDMLEDVYAGGWLADLKDRIRIVPEIFSGEA